MDKILVILLLGLASLYTASALTMSILGSSERPRLLKPGNSLDLVCHLDVGLSVILDYEINWIHEQPTINKSITLTSQQTLLPKVSNDHYDIDVKFDEDHINVTISLKNAITSMDGKYICRATANKGGEEIEKDVMVIVPNDVTEVTLNIDSEEGTDKSQISVQREEGEYTVSCRTKGFHPPGPLQLFLDDKLLKTDDKVSTDIASSKKAKALRSKATLQIKNLELQASDSGKVLKCVARAGFQGAVEKVASMSLVIIALEPEISCDRNASWAPGDKYVKLTCHVNHARVNVDYYRFEIGDSGDVIVQNEKSPDYDTVLVRKESDTVDHVTLVIYEAEAWHFDTYYYLDIFLEDGQRFRETAKLLKRDTTGGASKPVAYALCLVLSVLVWGL